MSKICILDYGFGNIKSLQNALKKIGYSPSFFSEKRNENYEFIFIPGVGSYSKASNIINDPKISGFIKKANENKVKFVGICLGMQLFHTVGYENGKNKGLNFINGEIIKFPDTFILPVIGWREVYFNEKHKFLSKFDKEKFYFVHSYFASKVKKNNIVSMSNYNKFDYVSSVSDNNYFGTQFHPEKSGDVGLEFLKILIKDFN